MFYLSYYDWFKVDMVNKHDGHSSGYYFSIDWPMEEFVIGLIIAAIWLYSIMQFIRWI